jgi:predicted ATP-dependent serine protease
MGGRGVSPCIEGGWDDAAFAARLKGGPQAKSAALNSGNGEAQAKLADATTRPSCGTGAKGPSPEVQIRARRASEITPVDIDWLWEGWLARRMLALIAGWPGVGKSTIAFKMAATVT